MLALIVAGCPDEVDTHLMLSIQSDTAVDTLEIQVRNISGESDRFSYPLEDKDITAEPLVLDIRKTPLLRDEFALLVQGFHDGALVAAASDVLRLSAGATTRATLQLGVVFRDEDNDWFPACLGPGCDCNDHSREIHPFAVELCDDSLDNNCSGFPINEGCACTKDLDCSCLEEQFLHLAGIGACALGTAVCEAGVLSEECACARFAVEDPENGKDDDCDGHVDEGGRCSPDGQTRRCFLGFVAGSEEITRALEYCPQLVGLQTCAGGHWGDCLGWSEPQRNPDQGFGWAETNAQCDGLDNDCNGRTDDHPNFDADRDGYTYCGTTYPAGSGLRAEDVDCDDAVASVHPGAVEVCGNGIDEDCLCDHGPSSGRPSAECAAEYAFLDCARETPQSCRDAGYYRGFLGDAQHCYFCGDDFGTSCDAATGGCGTESACLACDSPVRDDAALLAMNRSVCFEPDGGCTASTPPTWKAQDGKDLFDDCPAVACDGFYWGRTCLPNDVACLNACAASPRACAHAAAVCYRKADQTAVAHVCHEGACQSTQALCVAEPDHGSAVVAPGDVTIGRRPSGWDACADRICVQLAGGCAADGVTPPSFEWAAAGTDPFSACDAQTFRCDEAPQFFFGVETTGQKRECFYAADVTRGCSGGCGCETRQQACLRAEKGGSAAGRPRCQMVTADSCRDDVPPRYDYVAAGQDPFEECPGSLACNGHGACQVDLGGACSASSDCRAGSCNLALGRCCDACDPCESCGTNGLCAPVADGTADLFCAAGYLCVGGACADSCVACTTGEASQCAPGFYCNSSNDCVAQRSLGVASDVVCEDASCDSGDAVDGVCCSTASCEACHRCSLGNGICQPEDSTAGNACSGGGQFCCAGTCNTKASGLGGICGEEGCTATWTCNGSAAQCGTVNRDCTTCSADLSARVDGTCLNSGQNCSGNQIACGACKECNSGACVNQADGPGRACGGANYCCSGNCRVGGGAFASACGVGDCAGTRVCVTTNARCSTVGLQCAGCSGDSLTEGACSNNGQSCTDANGAEVCAACTRCVDTGISGSCVPNYYADYAEDVTGVNTCQGDKACVGAVCLNDDGVACGSDADCVSGFCVAGLCCRTDCPAFACQPSGAGCRGSCTDDVDCLASHYCNDAGQCVLDQANGATCNDDDECLNAHCVSGVCCNTACGGGCQSCTDGSCDACVLATQFCDGALVCTAKHAQGSACNNADQCLSGFCVDGVCCDGLCGDACETCAGTGVCRASGSGSAPSGGCANVCGALRNCPASCATAGCVASDRNYCNVATCTEKKTLGLACVTAIECLSSDCVRGRCADASCAGGYSYNAGSCLATCAAHADCYATYYCDGGTCRPQLGAGGVCALGNNEYCSGALTCEQGFCCPSSCSNDCETCASGVCSVRSVGSEPADGCDTYCGGLSSCPTSCDAASDCLSGYCQALGTCEPCGADTNCNASEFCSAGTCTAKVGINAACTRAGQCTSGYCADTADPVPDPDTCTACALDSHCSATEFCSAGTCTAKRVNAEVCDAANQCTSGYCADTSEPADGVVDHCAACSEDAHCAPGTCDIVSGICG